ncbi:MAG: outer membrane beta-barrel protein [Kangiellaceae bacterium]|nr:outer membrane beta-barrel protein [Kangiellaceae bacterium]
MNKNMKKVGLLLAAILGANLQADEQDTQWTASFGLGTADYQDGFFGDNDTLTTFSIGYHYTDLITFEASYIDLGSVSDSVLADNVVTLVPDILSIDSSGLTVSAKYAWEFSETFSVMANVGLSVLDSEVRYSGGTLVVPELQGDLGSTETEFYYGLAARYHMTETVTVDVAWDFFEIESANIDALYLKVNYAF